MADANPQTPVKVKKRNFFEQFYRLCGPYWYCAHKWRVRSMTLALGLLTLAQVGLAVWTSYWNRELFDALEQRSLSQFLLQLGTFVLIFVLTMAVTAVHLHVKRWLQLDWRDWISTELLDHWMCKGQHYRLQFMQGEHDNPDGRISEDIRIVTETTIALGHTLFFSILVLFSFVDILLAVSGSAVLPGTQIDVSGYMVWMAFLYAGIGAGLGLALGRPLVRTTNTLQTAEADFRFDLARARENSESIALMKGEPVERSLAARLFSNIREQWNRQTMAYTWIVSYTAGYGALLPVFPIIIAAPQYIAGTMTLGVLMQAAQAFQRLTSALSWPVDSLGDLARLRASADRVLSLYEDLLLLEEKASEPNACRIEMQEGDTPSLVLQHLTVADQDGLVVLENFNATIVAGECLLITGDQSVVSSLFKAVSGLWHWGQGFVWLPKKQSIMFLPQQPFLPAVPLQDVLAYPKLGHQYSQQAMQQALECAGVAWLVPRLQESNMWSRVLTTRAQQRVGFARVFLQKPAWIFIEEALDVFDEEGETKMVAALQQVLPQATVIITSLRNSMEKYCARKIVLTRSPEAKYLFDAQDQCLLPAVRDTEPDAVHEDAPVLLKPPMRRQTDPKR